jgi:hypothetical protein
LGRLERYGHRNRRDAVPFWIGGDGEAFPREASGFFISREL